MQSVIDIDPALAIRDGDIKRIFPPNTLMAGRSYEQRGRVQDIQIGARGALIRATTQGSQPHPYVQNLKISHAPERGIRIAGACSCPIGGACKHLAAVLIAVQRKEVQGARQAGALFPPHRRPLPGAEVPAQIRNWLDDYIREEDAPAEDYPASVRSRIFYVLDAAPGAGGIPVLRTDPMTVSLRKDNTLGSIKRYAFHQAQAPARYLLATDKLILARLYRRLARGGQRPEDDPVDTLRRILATGRARWGNAEGPVLTEGPERQGQIGWTTLADGAQRAELALDEGLVGFRVPPPWYADPVAGCLGPLDMGLPPRTLMRILNGQPMSPEAAADLRAHLNRGQALTTPRAKALRPTAPKAAPTATATRPADVAQGAVAQGAVAQGAPTPHLRLINGTLPTDPSGGRGSARLLKRGLYEVPLARLSYAYGSVIVPRSVALPPGPAAPAGKPSAIERDRAAEARILAELTGLGLASVHELVPVYYQHAHTDDFVLREHCQHVPWMQIVTQEVPRLRDAGWVVEIDEDFPVHVVSSDAEIQAELTEGSGIDWLDLRLGVTVDGEQVDLVPALVRLLSRPEAAALAEAPDDKPFVLPLPDGRVLTMPMARIRPLLQALLELWAAGGIDTDSDRIGFSRLAAADLARLEARSGLTWRGGEALRDLGNTLRQAGGIPRAVIPASFKATLRPYQSQGVDWLQFLGAAGLGGVLADDMGLGKTVQTLAHLMVDKAAGRLDRPSLIVCPTSLIPNWLAEASRFAPDLSILALHGASRKTHFKEIARHDLVLSTYPLLMRDADVLLRQDWHAVILDEAQSIKNPNAGTTRQALRLKARQRLCLSGTPLQNHLGELWSLFDFLAPGFLGSQKSFKDHYRTPIEKQGDAERQALLNRRIRPFMLRRTKEEVVTELPPKTEIVEPVALEETQRAIYEAVRLSMHEKVKAAIAQKGLDRSGIVILDALLKMRQVCCDPRLLKLPSIARNDAGSAKLDRLMEMLRIMLDEGRRVLLFSQFTEMLALIEERLRTDAIPFVTLTGDTKDRAAPVKAFQSGEVPVFLISLKAGGVGLNLTAADTVIHYDPWWNPAVEDQATDRAYRIGQTRKVFVHRLVTIGTIEEKMQALKEKKRALVAGVMDAGHGAALTLTPADIEELFGPPPA